MWNRFKKEEFEYSQILEILGEDEQIVSAVLSHLKKSGWLTIKIHPKDSRKRVYKLKNPQVAIEEMLPKIENENEEGKEIPKLES